MISKKLTLAAFLVYLTLSLPACGSTSPPPPTPINFLPLAVGNTWTYSRSVNPDKHVWYLQDVQRKEGGSSVLIARDINCVPGIHVETYRVIGQEKVFGEVDAWRVELESGQCRGRYEDVERILWFIDIERTKAADSSANELITYSEPWEPGLVDPPVQRRELVLLWKKLDSQEPIKTFLLINNIPIVQWTHKNIPLSITTPAGSFSECVEIIEDVIPFWDSKKGTDPFDVGWETYSYFCYNVGLVKEVQKDRNGEVTYILELTSHGVNEPKESP